MPIKTIPSIHNGNEGKLIFIDTNQKGIKPGTIAKIITISHGEKDFKSNPPIIKPAQITATVFIGMEKIEELDIFNIDEEKYNPFVETFCDDEIRDKYFRNLTEIVQSLK